MPRRDDALLLDMLLACRKIRALRNRLVHEYFAIRLDVLWDTIQSDIPPLMEQLEQIVPPENEGE
jgi:uncharacterized protein with HEPN domain